MNAPSPAGGGPGAAAPAARAHTPSPDLTRYLRRAQSRAWRMLLGAGVDIACHTVAVRAAFSLEGVVTELRVVRSSGSEFVDSALEAVLHKILRSDPPAGLLGGAITLRLGPGPRTPAKAF